MANERVDSIYDVAAINKEQQAVEVGLDSIQSKLIELNKTGNSLVLQLGDAKSIIELNTLLKELGVNSGNIIKVTAEQAKAQRDLNAAELTYQKTLTEKEKTQGQTLKNQQAELRLQQQSQRELDKTTAKQKEAAKQVQVLGNEYNALNSAHKAAALAAKNAGIAYGVESDLFKQLTAQAEAMRVKLEQVEQAQGQYNRQVGNYNIVGAQFAQILSELPNAALGARTFIISLSNNLGSFITNVVSAGKAGQSFAQILGSMFTSANVLLLVVNLAVTAFTAFGEALFSTSGDAKQAKSDIDELTESVNNYVDALKQEKKEIRDAVGGGNLQLKRDLELAKAQKNREKVAEIEKQIRANDIKDLESYGTQLNRIVTEIQKTTNKVNGVDESGAPLADRLRPLMSEEDLSRLSENLSKGVDVVDVYNKKIAALNQEVLDKKSEAEAEQAKYETYLREEAERKWKEYYRKLQEWEKLLAKIRREVANDNLKLTEEQVRSAVEIINRDSKSIFDTLLDRNVLRRRNEALNTSDSNRTQDLIGVESAASRGRFGNLANVTNHEKYERAKTDITYKYAIERFEIEKNALNEQLALLSPGSSEYLKAVDEINKIELQQKELQSQRKQNIDKKEAEKRIEIEKSVMQAIQQIQSIAFNYIRNLSKQQANDTLTRLDREKKAIEDRYQYQIDRITASMDAGVEREEAVARAQARAESQKIDIDNKRREASRRQAVFEKQLSISQIIADTALAVVRALGSKPYTPANIALAATTGAIGAAQLAAAIATPIPQYAIGTKNHPGGLAMVAEKEPELILDRGSAYMVSNPSVLDLAPHAQVFNQQQIHAMMSPQMIRALNNQKDKSYNAQLSKDIVTAIDRSASKTAKAMSKQKVAVGIYSNDYYLKYVKRKR